MRIIHLSDFHMESEEMSFRKKNLVNALINDLLKYVDDDTIIAFTGDLIDKGGSKFEDKEMSFLHFEEYFINPILQKTNLNKNKFFMIPGNHDIYRNDDDKYSEIGLFSELSNRDKINNFIEKNSIEGKQISKIKPFKAFEKSFYSDFPNKQLSYFDSNFTLELNKKTVGIACFNSSWRCFDENDKGKLIIGEGQVHRAVSFIKECDLKIALIHHSFDWLLEVDSKTVQPIIEREFDIVLSGHVHSTAGSYTSGFYGKLFHSVASSTIADYLSDREYTNGYSIINFKKDDSVIVEYRKYDEKNEKFILNTEAGNKEGYFEVLFPTQKQIEVKKKQEKAIENILNTQISPLDEDLIIYNAGTKASCKINDVFVEPRISNVPNSKVSDKKILYYTIDSIIKNDSNFLIYGLKESGKTILLDKFLIDISNNYAELKQIPILIDFSEIGTKGLDTVIMRFLNVGIQDVEEFLLNEKVVLLIDNLTFDTKSQHKFNKINNLVRSYPNVKIIAASEQTIESSIPTNYLEFSSGLNFELGFIQSLSSKEIKSLIQNWFKGRDSDFKENIQKLINSFTKLALPRTPLSVTLFLWIIERQEKKPINNSTLVELFVENLLEKANFENVFSQTFDYKNKQRLLSHVAHFMLNYGNGEENYKVSNRDLEDFLNKYLDLRINEKPQNIISDFINRGIFIQIDDHFIKFKASFLFHFFLAKHMEFDENFKKYVISDSFYLEFTNEIEYYTGLKRDDISILKFTQQKLDEAFKDINIQMENQNIDKFFETKTMLSSQINLDKVKNKPTEDEFDEIYDEQLSDIPINTPIPKKELTIENIDIESRHIEHDKIFKLAAMVLKNSEEIDDIELKKASYKNILKTSISFLVFSKAIMINTYESNGQVNPKNFPPNIDFKFFIRLLPLIHQSLLHDWMGTLKMSGIIKDKIDRDRNNIEISELEKFLSVFIYSDIKGQNYPFEIKRFLKGVKRRYMKDTCFFKLISYYFIRSNDKETDALYLELMADVTGRQKQSKDKFMKQLAREKQLKIFKGEED